MLKIDLRQGFGDFPDYEMFKFPDGSIKFKLKKHFIDDNAIIIKSTLRNNDDLFLLAMIKDVADRQDCSCVLDIDYMMYQQDDRRFSEFESFGLKVVADFINSLNFKLVRIFHPHSDKVELINNCVICDNTSFLANTRYKYKLDDDFWVIPDSGAFKTQFKQIEKLNHKNFIVCNKSRDPNNSKGITTVVNTEDLRGRDCFIVDDICLGGNTFINIAKELQKKNCGNLYLIVSHGVFNNGIEHLKPYFKRIITTTSICTLPEDDFLKLYEL